MLCSQCVCVHVRAHVCIARVYSRVCAHAHVHCVYVHARVRMCACAHRKAYMSFLLLHFGAQGLHKAVPADFVSCYGLDPLPSLSQYFIVLYSPPAPPWSSCSVWSSCKLWLSDVYQNCNVDQFWKYSVSDTLKICQQFIIIMDYYMHCRWSDRHSKPNR